MLSNLSIKNYALIEDINVNFSNGLTIITGETGAGKSILLGGLSLILGKRADLSVIKDASKKCIIEAVFDIERYKLKAVFDNEDLDYDPQTIIRREILPSGKSRAFVNDSPVKLEALQNLSKHLIDVHSQHETLELTTNAFQFKIIDALADNQPVLDAYTKQLNIYSSKKNSLKDLKTFQANALKELDYNTFLLQELHEANLQGVELEVLEEEFNTLDNVEQVKEKLLLAEQLLNEDQIGVLSTLRTLKNEFQDITEVSEAYKNLFERIESSFIELDDINSELEHLKDAAEADPERLEVVSSKISQINSLLNKHNTVAIEDLLAIQTELEHKVNKVENLDTDIETLELEISKLEKELKTLAKQIHENRTLAIPRLKEKLIDKLKDLGMENAGFDISVTLSNTLHNNGMDELKFLFSANKGGSFKTLKKSASGGELSRIMLALKSILSNYLQLPTIMFDEIDTGVSGEISKQMGNIMKQMSAFMQVFAITHLPQIAAKGDSHFKVFKTDIEDVTQTQLQLLNDEERIVEIAQMLGGSKVSESAIVHAKELLN